MIILLHSSKTMTVKPGATHTPQLIGQTKSLAQYLQSLTPAQLAKVMKLSGPLAAKTHSTYAQWNDKPAEQTPAIDSFIGDIYSGLQAPTFDAADRQYAHEHLRILSGLYGILRALDGISPYRLEMGYKLPDPAFASLYDFWGKSIAETLPPKVTIINLCSEEFSDVVTPYIDQDHIISPKFLTMDAKKGEPTFVVVHAKIARGAFAHWMIKKRIEKVADLKSFDELGYKFDAKQSTPEIPVYVCQEFGGKGLSMKKQKKF